MATSQQKETADALTDELDKGKQIAHAPPLREFGSYWDQWLARRRAGEAQNGQADLLLKYLLGQGDRPDLGAGVNYMGCMGNFSDVVSGSSAGCGGSALTMSNLGEINPERRYIRRLG